MDQRLKNHVKEVADHKEKVYNYIQFIITNLHQRALDHDDSKLSPEEIEGFAYQSEELKKAKFGTPKYEESREAIKSTLDHHYANNRHHPEYHKDGYKSMDLIDIMEMTCDWVSAYERMLEKGVKNVGTLEDSLYVCKNRFNMSDELFDIIKRTAMAMYNTEINLKE